MKKLIVMIIIIVILSVGSIFVWTKILNSDEKKEEDRIKNARIEVTLNDNLTAEFYSKKKVSDFITSINGDIVDDFLVDTNTVGKSKVEFEFVNDEGIQVPYSYEINVVDTVAPSIWISSTYFVNKGYYGDLLEEVTCADNYDDNPKCEIIGDYNPDVVGDYNLTFVATDSSGNKTTKDFILKVITPTGSGSRSSSGSTTFDTVVSWYKSDNSKIGIDVSEWQNEIDFEAVKNAGVEFAIIRVGGTKGIDGEYFLDAQFKRNIEGFKSVGIPVGIYFYSYAKDKEAAINDAKWVIEQIKDYEIDLPIAYDWENWSFYNDFHNSFYTLTNNAMAFLNTLKDAGYDGMLYSSYNYLEKAWFDVPYTHWLAHYTDKTDYKGEYTYWQLCSNGEVAGINGYVDINVMFLK